MEKRLQGDIFLGLKQALKARGMTYADLAGRMGVSEPTVKRLFVDQDCKLTRLLEICDLLGLSLADLAERGARSGESQIDLPTHVETALAADPGLFHMLILMREGMSVAELAAHFDLDLAWVTKRGLELERLGLARTTSGGQLVVPADRPIRFRQHGPLHQLLCDMNLRFVKSVFNNWMPTEKGFVTLSRQMLPDTARALQQDVDALAERVARLSRQDQMVAPPEALQRYKLSLAFAPVNFAELIDLQGPAPQKPRPLQKSRSL